ncbi:MAG: hypothetical protein KAS12_02705, partial [Candidatus Aenigmarchaeota archaeon]|nr:hypothetical protein [Candidatus Aenigmarchaeota archaeon]
SNCTFNTSSCSSEPVVLCGNGVIDPGESCGEPGLSCNPGFHCALGTCMCVIDDPIPPFDPFNPDAS